MAEVKHLYRQSWSWQSCLLQSLTLVKALLPQEESQLRGQQNAAPPLRLPLLDILELFHDASWWNCSLEDISLLFSQEIQERNRIFIILNLWRLSICSNVDAMMILMPFYSLTFHGLLFYLSLLVKLFFHESFSMIFTDNKQIDLKNGLIIFGSSWFSPS